jgi:hypothetical protein
MEYEALHGRSYQPGEAHLERRRDPSDQDEVRFSATLGEEPDIVVELA